MELPETTFGDDDDDDDDDDVGWIGTFPNKGDDDQVYLLWAALASFHSCDCERRLKRTLKKRGMSEKLKRLM